MRSDTVRAEIVVVGGGIVGLSSAYKLAARYPRSRIVLLEKESGLAMHQTGRNSGVIHSGIYYKPGSLKAKTCRDGRAQLIRYCQDQGVPFQICGKLIVALGEGELASLSRIFERGRSNGVNCETVEASRMKEIEPHVAGIRGIHVRDTGIVDYVTFCQKLAAGLESAGHSIVLGAKVLDIAESERAICVETTRGVFEGAYLVNCAGLQADRIARLGGAQPKAKIVPFRGEYYRLRSNAEGLCRNLIYPVPDPEFPFLGVHFTRMVAGGVECGPNAVLAFAREGYRKTSVRLGDLVETLAYRGFQRIVARHYRMGLSEMHRSISKRAFVAALKRLVPEVQADDLEPIEPGIRAQAVLPDGTLMDDFSFEETVRAVHVVNAVSPAATAALAIADAIVDRLAPRLGH